MRLLERTLRTVWIAPYETHTDGLGAVVEGFSAERIPVRASLIPVKGDVEAHEAGLIQSGEIRLLTPLDTKISVGDGVLPEKDGPVWRCVEIERWSGHLALRAVKTVC